MKRLFIVALLALLGIGLVVPSQADGTTGQAPFGYNPPVYYADNSFHTHRSIECNQLDFLHFNHFMHFTFAHDVNPTDITTSELTPTCATWYSQDDTYWYATSNLGPSINLGTYECMWISGTLCYRGRVLLRETMRTTHSWAVKWNVACHEVGHAIGFSHGTAQQNCMDEGGTGNFDQYMINQINSYY